MSEDYTPTTLETIFELLDKKLVTFGIPGALGFVGITKARESEWKEAAFCFAGAAGVWIVIKVGKRLAPKLDQLLDWGINGAERAILEGWSALCSDFEGQYLKQQARLCEEFTSEGFNPDKTTIPLLEEVFVPLDLSGALGRGGVNADAELTSANLDIWKLLKRSRKDRKFRKMVILAKGGMGKTTLLRHIALVYGQRKQRRHRAPKLVPVLLRLRDWRDELTQKNPPSLPKLIAEHHVPSLSRHQQLTVPKQWTEKLLASDSALVMLDGFDEIPENKRKQVSRWIATQMREYDRAVFILTSRPAGYKDYAAQKPAVPIFVNQFTPAQQEDFVRRWYLCQELCVRSRKQRRRAKEVAQERADQLLAQLEARREELGYMAENPLLLNLLVTFHRFDVAKTLPQQRISLYRGIIKLQLEDRPRARGIQMLLPFSKSETVLQELALEMVKLHYQTVKRKQLLNFLEKHPILQAEVVGETDFLKQIIDVSELLVEREPGDYEFPHLSFQGFFAATRLAKAKTREDIGKSARLVIRNWNKAVWRETVLLYAAQLSPKILDQIIRNACKIDSEAAELAALCLKEYPRPEKFTNELTALFEKLSEVTQDSKYAKLEKLLKAKHWKEADNETYRLMVTTVGKEEGQFFDSNSLRYFPCKDLQILNHLWFSNSEGRYGFSVQKKIWEKYKSPKDYGADWEKFCEELNWRMDSSFPYDFHQLDLSRPGVLPYFPFYRFMSWSKWRYFSCLAQRFSDCQEKQLKL